MGVDGVGGRGSSIWNRATGTSGSSGTSGTDSSSGADNAGSSGIDFGGDAFDADGPSGFSPGEVLGSVSSGSSALAAEARRRLLEANIGSADSGNSKTFSWDRGPRAAAGREWSADKSRKLTSKSKTVEGKQVFGSGETSESKGGRFKDWSASATVFSKGVGGEKTWKKVEGQADLGGGVKAQGEAHLGKAWGVAVADAAVDLKTGTVTGTAQLTGEARLAGVEGSVRKDFGDDQNNVGVMGWGKAYVGASGTGKVDVRLNPKEGTAVVGGEVEAFAGAKAVGVIRPSVKIAGEDISSHSGVTGEAWAGVGVKARAEAGIEKGRLKANFELGAALGVGGKIGVNLDVNLVGVKNVAVKGYNAAKGKVADAASTVKDAAAEGYDRASSAVGDAFQAAKSWW